MNSDMRLVCSMTFVAIKNVKTQILESIQEKILKEINAGVKQLWIIIRYRMVLYLDFCTKIRRISQENLQIKTESIY